METSFFATKWVLEGLRWLYNDVTQGSIVLTIIIFTIFIRLLTIFGDIQSRKTTAKTQAIQPELDKLKKKYANNPQKMQQAQSKLMKENGVSMFGGCLPMLITMPLFIIFLNAFRFWGYEQTARVIVELDQTGASSSFASFNFLWVHNIWQADSGLKPVVASAVDFLKTPNLKSLLYFAEDPTAREVFERLGFFVEDVKNIPQLTIDNYDTLMAPLAKLYEGYNNGWFLWPILSAGTSFLSAWITQKNQPAPASAPDSDKGQSSAAASTSKTMMYVMPAMSFFFCLTYNAAFAIYWTLSNVVSLLTNILINKRFKKDTLSQEGVQK